MKVLKTSLRYLPFVTVIFIMFYLLRSGFPAESLELKPLSFFISLLFLASVFFLRAFIWYKFLIRFGIHVSKRIALSSYLRTMLLKYIPGKVWSIVGQASLVAQHGYSFKNCSVVSLFLQMVMIISGLGIGIFGILIFNYPILPSWICYISLFTIAGVVIVSTQQFIVPALNIRYIPNPVRRLAGLKLPPLADIFLLCFLNWLAMGGAFLLFIRSIGFNLGFFILFLQPLANNIGIISSFAPAGLGVREGAMAGYLVIADTSPSVAALIALASRFWFLLAELFVFLLPRFFRW